MIRYERLNDDSLAVYIGRKRVGTIIAAEGGYRYRTKTAGHMGPIFPTVQEVQKDLA